MITHVDIDFGIRQLKVWGFLFAYPDSVVVSIRVWHATESGSIPQSSNLNYGSDHPQMISPKATSTL